MRAVHKQRHPEFAPVVIHKEKGGGVGGISGRIGGKIFRCHDRCVVRHGRVGVKLGEGWRRAVEVVLLGGCLGHAPDVEAEGEQRKTAQLRRRAPAQINLDALRRIVRAIAKRHSGPRQLKRQPGRGQDHRAAGHNGRTANDIARVSAGGIYLADFVSRHRADGFAERLAVAQQNAGMISSEQRQGAAHPGIVNRKLQGRGQILRKRLAGRAGDFMQHHIHRVAQRREVVAQDDGLIQQRRDGGGVGLAEDVSAQRERPSVRGIAIFAEHRELLAREQRRRFRTEHQVRPVLSAAGLNGGADRKDEIAQRRLRLREHQAREHNGGDGGKQFLMLHQ